MNGNILIVDDEKEITDLVGIFLKNDGFRVIQCKNGQEALECVEREPVDLAVLDVMLPDMDGFTICQKIREKYFFPIIMLTARVEDADKITGLTVGADDYMTKPFNPLELVTRVKSQLRRYTRYNSATEEPEEILEYHIRGLEIWKNSHRCTLNGSDLELTPMEFEIVWTLCENHGQVVSTEDLFERVWKEKYLDSNNTVMAHIARIREKMKETPRKPEYIKTGWGVGYTIDG